MGKSQVCVFKKRLNFSEIKKEFMAGTARKSTGSKRKSTKVVRSALKRKIVKVDPQKEYEVSKFGPIWLSWGKKKVKNSKGKLVKQWYIKKDHKHQVWVKWASEFQDEKAQHENFQSCQWSAEPQSCLDKNTVKEVLKEKVIWPWPKRTDENYEDRIALLKERGYKEWRASNNKKGNAKNWNVQNPIEVLTGSSEGEEPSGDESTSNTDEPEEEEQDEV